MEGEQEKGGGRERMRERERAERVHGGRKLNQRQACVFSRGVGLPGVGVTTVKLASFNETEMN
jgi:hypothetical protein